MSVNSVDNPEVTDIEIEEAPLPSGLPAERSSQTGASLGKIDESAALAREKESVSSAAKREDNLLAKRDKYLADARSIYWDIDQSLVTAIEKKGYKFSKVVADTFLDYCYTGDFDKINILSVNYPDLDDSDKNGLKRIIEILPTLGSKGEEFIICLGKAAAVEVTQANRDNDEYWEQVIPGNQNPNPEANQKSYLDLGSGPNVLAYLKTLLKNREYIFVDKSIFVRTLLEEAIEILGLDPMKVKILQEGPVDSAVITTEKKFASSAAKEDILRFRQELLQFRREIMSETPNAGVDLPRPFYPNNYQPRGMLFFDKNENSWKIKDKSTGVIVTIGNPTDEELSYKFGLKFKGVTPKKRLRSDGVEVAVFYRVLNKVKELPELIQSIMNNGLISSMEDYCRRSKIRIEDFYYHRDDPASNLKDTGDASLYEGGTAYISFSSDPSYAISELETPDSVIIEIEIPTDRIFYDTDEYGWEERLNNAMRSSNPPLMADQSGGYESEYTFIGTVLPVEYISRIYTTETIYELKESPVSSSVEGVRLQDNKQIGGSTTLTTGGVDFRALPTATINQPINTAAFKLSTADLNRLSNINLDSEWAGIQKMINTGYIPSNERIREYVVSSCLRQTLGREMGRVLGCIADIMRIEEDCVSDTNTELNDMLVLLEASKPESELLFGLSQIRILPQQPKF